MKKIALSALVFFTAASALAYKNPQIHACNIARGEFMVVNAPYDQIGLCKLGLSLVGSIDLLNKDAHIEIPLSLYNYKKGIVSCTLRNIATFTTFDGQEINVCYYSDGSVIDLETLITGKNNSRNTDLNRALGL